jgi:hypothetical protein
MTSHHRSSAPTQPPSADVPSSVASSESPTIISGRQAFIAAEVATLRDTAKCLKARVDAFVTALDARSDDELVREFLGSKTGFSSNPDTWLRGPLHTMEQCMTKIGTVRFLRMLELEAAQDSDSQTG